MLATRVITLYTVEILFSQIRSRDILNGFCLFLSVHRTTFERNSSLRVICDVTAGAWGKKF